MATVDRVKVAVVTGGSSGIGRAVSLALGARAFHVVVAGRARERVDPVVDEIQALGGSAEAVMLDLASLQASARAAEDVARRHHSIDLLVNNAGVGRERGLTEDGFEVHFGVNHLGHFMFNRGLWEVLTPGSRVVTVTSALHRRADGIDFDRVLEPGRSGFRIGEYAVSKLANVLYSAELARRRPDLRTYGVHPGLVDTKILPRVARLAWRRRMLTPEEGATPIVRCATDPELGDESGGYYSRMERQDPSSAASDTGLAAELWERSEGWCTADPPD